MHWYDTLCAEVAEHTGQAQVRLLRAILLSMSPPHPGRASVSVKQAEVLERLGEALADATLRQRVKAINDAAEVITRWGADRPFVLHSKKPEFVVEFSAGYLASTTLGPVERSTDEDTKAATVGAQKPRAQKPMQVFVSHAWENDRIKAVLDDFIADLKRKLARPPRTWVERFPKVEVFFDRTSMTGRDTYTAQAMAACEQSRLAIFMLSDGWYNSEPCQAEARHFIDADGKPCPNRVIAVQLIHKVEDRPESFKDWPIYPRHGGHKHDTLVALWERGDITDKEKLVRAIAEDVWFSLSQAVDDDLPLPIDRRLAYYHPQFDPHVRDGTAQSPTAVTREGKDDAFDLIPVLTEWATSPEAPNRYFALLGSFGSGKTTTVQLLAQTLLTEFRKNPNNPLPVYLDFRRLQQAYALDESRQFSLAELILHCLHQDQTDQIDATSLLTTLRGRACVILFDGLDEIGMRVGVERASALYRQLIEIVPAEARHRDQATGRADWAACPIRILISCRTHFFRDYIDERSTLAGHDRDGPGRTSQLMRTAYMAPFTPKQIESFLTCHLGTEKGQAAFQTLRQIHDLPGLAKKPIMTRYIAEVMPELKADADAGRQINVATVYQRLFRQAVERDRGKRGKLTPGDREAILQALAHSLWQQRAATLPVTALEDWFDDYCATRPGLSRMLGSGDNRELMHTELRNSTLLERSGEDHFRFTHTSFQEYFLARGLRDLLVKGAMATLTKAPPVSVETIDFLADIADTHACWRAVADGVAAVLAGQGSAAVRQLAVALFRRLRHRSSTMFVPSRLNLAGLDLSGDRADWLSHRQLDGADLSGATLLGADLRQVQFRTCLLEGTILGSVAFDRCTFTACSGAPRSLASARAFACDDPDGFLPNGGLVLDFPTGGKNFRAASPPSYLLRPHLRTVRSASFSHDGARIVTSSDDSTARVWDARSGQTLLTLEGHQYVVTSASFSHDGSRIVTSSDDNTARVWDANTGKELEHFTNKYFNGLEGNPTTRSLDGTRILKIDRETTQICDAATGKPILIRVHINDAWFVIDENDVVLRMSENGWRHIYGKEVGPDGQIRIVAPRMPEVVSG